MANCQFPRAIREEGREYEVPPDAISFSQDRHRKFFYRVRKNAISIVETSVDLSGVTVYGGEDDDMDCVVCMCNEKDSVFIPCGHYCCCFDCATLIKNGGSTSTNCPLCRTPIDRVVHRDEIEG